jgi:hypothetical protein
MEVIMNVTEEMLDVAMKKAVEAGLLPRHACREDLSVNQELIRHVLQAALDTLASEASPRKPAGASSRHNVLRRFVDVRENVRYPKFARG